jgi:hypothetical protein
MTPAGKRRRWAVPVPDKLDGGEPSVVREDQELVIRSNDTEPASTSTGVFGFS